MTNDNLMEFLQERVFPVRLTHHMTYPADMDEPSVGVILDCPEDQITCVLLPTFVKDVLHMEVHTFVDGQRVDPAITKSEETDGCCELILRRPSARTTLA